MAERRLVIETVDTGTLSINGTDYAVRIGADLDVDVLAEIMRLQLEIRRYGTKSDAKLADWTNRAKRLIVSTIQEHHPDVDDVKLSPSAMIHVLSFLGGSDDVVTGVARDLAEGAPDTGEEGSTDPTKSPRRSRSRSSRSARASTSAPSGGEDSAGASSSPTSPISTAA